LSEQAGFLVKRGTANGCRAGLVVGAPREPDVFSYLGGTTARWLAPHVATVTPDAEGEDRYFPERTLARWLKRNGFPSTVYAFEKVGVRRLTQAYRTLCTQLEIDAVVLVDGGTDILMFGDEAGLGTPEEEMASLAAVRACDVPTVSSRASASASTRTTACAMRTFSRTSPPWIATVHTLAHYRCHARPTRVLRSSTLSATRTL
jgi:hypothetical protein